MRRTTLIVFALAVLPLLSCHKGEKDRLVTGALPGTNGASALGTLSVYVGGNSAGQSPVSVLKTQTTLKEALLTVSGLEVTTAGNTWIQLISTPTTITISDTLGPPVLITEVPVNLIPDEYSGLRITFAPSPTFTQYSDGGVENLNPYPDIQYIDSSTAWRGTTPDALLTSANGALVPFRIEPGKTTYLNLTMYMSQGGPDPIWHLWVAVRFSKLPPS